MSEYWIQTHSGKRFDLLDPAPEMVDVGDIAHALGMICRFTGHCSRPYSVAEHCVWGSIVAESHADFEIERKAYE